MLLQEEEVLEEEGRREGRLAREWARVEEEERRTTGMEVVEDRREERTTVVSGIRRESVGVRG